MSYGPKKSFADVVEDIEIERKRQDEKWGVQNHNLVKWSVILGEETGEVCKAALENDMSSMRDELIQVAAVAIAAIECIDRSSA
jgi:NTP pyrophosphatase (non-canonical NTP hydrolase)